jgi:hypothetical protein
MNHKGNVKASQAASPPSAQDAVRGFFRRTLRALDSAIDLGPQGIRDIAIPVDVSIDLAGSVSVEGPDAEKHVASFVNLVPGDDIPWNAPPLRANVNKDGTFKITGVPPGIWDIGVGPIPPDGYLKSMRLGNQDVLTEEMMIRSSTSESLKIVLSTRLSFLYSASMGEPRLSGAFIKFRELTNFQCLHDPIEALQERVEIHFWPKCDEEMSFSTTAEHAHHVFDLRMRVASILCNKADCRKIADSTFLDCVCADGVLGETLPLPKDNLIVHARK